MNRRAISRRECVALLAASGLALAGCESTGPIVDGYGSARLTARPRAGACSATTGLRSLGLGNSRDAQLFVPAGNCLPRPLVVALHGTGRNASEMMSLLRPHAERLGFLLLAIDSRDVTWDASMGYLGPDVDFIDRALNWVFDRYQVSAGKVSLAGFSDGGSYALCLGLANGDLLGRIAAFSPGYIPKSDSPAVGRARVFVSHGTDDTILPIDLASRVIVPRLTSLGHEVHYTEFTGGHTVPATIAAAAAEWLIL